MEQKTIKTLKAEFKAANAKAQAAIDASFTRERISQEARERLNVARRAATKAMAEASIALINAQIAAKNTK